MERWGGAAGYSVYPKCVPRAAGLVAGSRAFHGRGVAGKLQYSSAGAVAEIQGLYGPFSFPEKLLQKIWLRGDFNRGAAVTVDGRHVSILSPGKWNLLGGPDFRGARLRFGDEPEVTGDVEIHLHVEDWAAHAHANDRAYDGVTLHVVLFPPEDPHETRGGNGQRIPVLVLLPLLHHDLEEFAAEEAVELLAGRAGEKIPEELATMGEAELAALLRTCADGRWRQKVHFARLRIQRLGWNGACHYTALEILGYRFNRAPMLRVASCWPLAEWDTGKPDVEEIFAAEREAWSLQGVRPANHPRTRLRQYAAWTAVRPDWPAQLGAFGAGVADIATTLDTRAARRQHAFGRRRKELEALCAGAVGGTRLDNLACDGFFPLLAAQGGRDRACQAWWFHWWTGDMPPRIAQGFRQLKGFSVRTGPACHGLAQGLLGWLIERETRR